MHALEMRYHNFKTALDGLTPTEENKNSKTRVNNKNSARDTGVRVKWVSVHEFVNVANK